MPEDFSNKRVAKNTLILYVRMFITLGVRMWTSRIVLNALGFTDQGLYNLVGGFVGFLSLLTDSINGAFGRYITFEIGRDNPDKINKVFRNATTVQWVLSLLVLILAETAGLWFVHHKMVIPPERMHAVLIVYQLSILSFILGLTSSALVSLVISYEKMNVLAGVSIANAFGGLAIAFAIRHTGMDRLILFASLGAILSFCSRAFYSIYCRRTFRFIRFGFSFDKKLFGSIFSFAGWNSIGTSAAILRSSGTSILLNLFGGPVANAINGIANSVNSLATIFIGDFTTAFNPQITKRYAAGDYPGLIRFLHQCSKFSYSLLLIMAVPVMIHAEPLMILWLKKIPEGTVLFARLIIVFSLIECICRPLITAKNATGEIRNYQLVVGGILLLTIPISYLFLKLGLPLWFSYIAIILTSSGAFVARMVMLQGAIPGWSSRKFLSTVVLRCVLATGVAFSIPLILHIILPDTMFWALLQCFVGFLWCCLCVYFIACDGEERKILKSMLINVLQRIGISK